MPKQQPEPVGEVDVCIELQARLIQLGFEFDEAAFDLSDVLAALQQVTLTVTPPTAEQVVEYAQRALTKEGTIEIDDDAKVSRSAANEDRGAYVTAWLWVADDDCRAFFAAEGEDVADKE